MTLFQSEPDIVDPVGVGQGHPRGVAPPGMVVGNGRRVEDEAQVACCQPVGELDVFRAAKAGVEPPGGKKIPAAQGGVAGIPEAGSGLPAPGGHGPILFEQHGLFPLHPGGQGKPAGRQHGAEHHETIAAGRM